MEDSMGMALFLAILLAFAFVLYRFIVYVVPAFVGLSAFLWAANTGAGIGSVVAGGVAGVAMFLLGYFLLRGRQAWQRWTAILLYTAPAAVAGFYAARDVGSLGLVPSPTWREVFGAIAAVFFAVAAFKGLAAPREDWAFARRR
jgi:hypothetical protein